MKKIVRIAAAAMAAVVLVCGIYVAYVLISYYRLDDNIELEVGNNQPETAQTDSTYTITSYNVGFGAYSRDYSFFMDGGKYSRAYSKEEAIKNISSAANIIAALNPDFAFFQEVDTKATRSYYVDEAALISDVFQGYTSAFAQNYDSPYLLYPVSSPIGMSLSGLETYSKFSVSSALRRSLPVESGFRKLLDLDRCYSITRIPVDDGEELVLINLHLSAYTADVTIGEAQLKMLFKDAAREYSAGNYVLIGGDFNKDILGDSPEVFHTKTDVPEWAKPLNKSLIPAGFTVLRPEITEDIKPTVRDCDTGYVQGETFVSAIDGFIVSDNITPVYEEHLDTDFMYSDHNPVILKFKLNSAV